ncbi:MAG: restriction endonuclease subunit S [Leptospiraceae bacterium]|nr:restriction endonuclease subunit S [Leptospiraceae bacterium]
MKNTLENPNMILFDKLPKDWKDVRLKYLVGLIREKTSESFSSEQLIGLENIESWYGRRIKTESESIEIDENSSINSFSKNDVLFGKLRPYLAKALIVDFNGICSNELLVMRPRAVVTNKYLLYSLLNKSFIELVNSSAYGTKMPRAEWDFIGTIKIPLPPLSTQKAIANFLDKETARIDSLISAKERFIGLLEEKRKATITEAVTRGLSPDVKMKDSGVEWLGRVPRHWEVVKLKYVGYLKSGESITSESIRDVGEYPVYGGNGLRGFTDSFTHEGEFVLIGRQGALCGNINYAKGKFFASEHAVVVSILNKNQTDWLGALLNAMNLNQYSQSAAQPGLSVDTIKGLDIPVPPISEQKQIVDFIRKQTTRIDKLIQKTNESLELLKERRTALIGEAVTSKLKIGEKV